MNGLASPSSLVGLLKPCSRRIAVQLLGIAAASCFGAAYPYFSGRLVDAVVRRDAHAATVSGAALAVSIIVATVIWTVNRRSVVRLAADFAHIVRQRVFRKLALVDLATIAALSDVRARTRVDSDVKCLTDSLDNCLLPLAAAVIQLTVLLGAVIALSVPMFVALVLSLVPLFVLSRFDARASQRAAEEAAAAGDRLASSIATHLSFGGVLRARAFGRTVEDGAAFAGDSLLLRDAAARIQERGAVRVLITQSVSAMVTLAILLVGIQLVMRGQVSVGVLVAFITYQQLVSEPILQLARAPNQLASLRVSARRVEELLRLPEPAAGRYRPPGEWISLRDVTYRYPDGTVGIENVSLDIRRGERIAIVGPSGSGKSTLAMVIQGLYTPQSGVVLIDGLRLQECEQRSVREMFAFDATGVSFVPGTVRRNITYGAPSDDVQRCARAARDAHADDFVEALPDGYETLLDDGRHGFSAGQLRRLGVARALAAKRPFLVLDEPTGPLDAATAKALFERLRSGPGGYIVATHDLEALECFDRIVVMAQNAIAYEVGPPQREQPTAGVAE